MTKKELMENYTKEGLADEYVAMEQFYEVEKYKLKYMKELEEQNKELKEKLRCENFRKKFKDENKKCEFEIAEYQKKIEELNAENAELHCELQAVNAFKEGYPTEPIKVADMLINEFRKGNNYTYLGISELRQIAERLLVYCNNNGESEE